MAKKSTTQKRGEPIGQTLRRHRIDVLGLGLREMARKINITPVHLSDIETGRRSPSESFLIQLAEHYGLDLAMLRAGWKKPDAIVTEVASHNATHAEKVPELLRVAMGMNPTQWDELIAEAKRLSKRSKQ